MRRALVLPVWTRSPPGEPKDDPYFGPQQVFHQTAVIAAWLNRESFAEQEVRIKVDYQGCAEIGVCYPPLSQTVPVDLAGFFSVPGISNHPGASRSPG
jgi:thiol:disulfide interchange protein DsbD